MVIDLLVEQLLQRLGALVVESQLFAQLQGLGGGALGVGQVVLHVVGLHLAHQAGHRRKAEKQRQRQRGEGGEPAEPPAVVAGAAVFAETAQHDGRAVGGEAPGLGQFAAVMPLLAEVLDDTGAGGDGELDPQFALAALAQPPAVAGVFGQKGA